MTGWYQETEDVTLPSNISIYCKSGKSLNNNIKYSCFFNITVDEFHPVLEHDTETHVFTAIQSGQCWT